MYILGACYSAEDNYIHGIICIVGSFLNEVDSLLEKIGRQSLHILQSSAQSAMQSSKVYFPMRCNAVTLNIVSESHDM